MGISESDHKALVLVNAIANGASQKAAMLQAGYSPKTAEGGLSNLSQGRRNRVRELLVKQLELSGLTPATIAGKLAEGVNSTKPLVIEGEIHDYPDYLTRLSYLDKVCKVLDVYPSEKVDIQVETYEERVLRLYSHSQAIPTNPMDTVEINVSPSIPIATLGNADGADQPD